MAESQVNSSNRRGFLSGMFGCCHNPEKESHEITFQGHKLKERESRRAFKELKKITEESTSHLKAFLGQKVLKKEFSFVNSYSEGIHIRGREEYLQKELSHFLSIELDPEIRTEILFDVESEIIDEDVSLFDYIPFMCIWHTVYIDTSGKMTNLIIKVSSSEEGTDRFDLIYILARAQFEPISSPVFLVRKNIFDDGRPHIHIVKRQFSSLEMAGLDPQVLFDFGLSRLSPSLREHDSILQSVRLRSIPSEHGSPKKP
mmetsp:Transcript_6883/g.7617  ORF Transcript_6883/g.7617 Transcript_6883/m.7617 type:complete len:258 (+) Transcript_6883:49-822(+)